MKFLEVKQGELSIRREKIVAVERKDEILTTIYTESGTFESDLPYQSVIDILEMTSEDDLLKSMAGSLKQLEQNDQLFGG